MLSYVAFCRWWGMVMSTASRTSYLIFWLDALATALTSFMKSFILLITTFLPLSCAGLAYCGHGQLPCEGGLTMNSYGTCKPALVGVGALPSANNRQQVPTGSACVRSRRTPDPAVLTSLSLHACPAVHPGQRRDHASAGWAARDRRRPKRDSPRP